MLSRRRILKLGTAAVGAVFVSPATAATSENNCPAIAPSIASLKSTKDQAKPISTEERVQRQEKARRLMTDNELDAILLTEGTSLTYFSGIHWGGGERLFAMVLPVKGNAFYVCPAFEEGRAREQIANGPDAKQADVRIWQENESPYQKVAQGFNDRGLSTGTVGMEETARFVFTQGIGKASPQLKIAPAAPVTAGCRMIKSDHEVELMRLAAKVTLTAYEAAYRALNPGMTKPQLEEMVEAAHTRLGFSGVADVQVGEYSAFPHGSVTPQVIREGAIVLMDGGGTVEG